MKRKNEVIYCVCIWLSLFLLFPTVSPSFSLLESQTGISRKIDEYRVKDLVSEDEQMRLWSAFDELAKEPKDTRLFIIAYGELPGSARRYANRAKNYLVSSHGVDSSRIVAVDGGGRTGTAIEIWLVPIGAPEPTPQPGAAFEAKSNVAWEYDEYPLDGWWFGDYGRCCEREPERLDGFAAALKSNPQSKGYLVVYRGTVSCETCLKPGAELKFAKYEKEYLVKKRQIEPARIVILRGGKIGGEVQLWVVPSGASLPRVKYSLRSRR